MASVLAHYAIIYTSYHDLIESEIKIKYKYMQDIVVYVDFSESWEPWGW